MNKEDVGSYFIRNGELFYCYGYNLNKAEPVEHINLEKEVEQMNQFDSTLTKSLEDFMESYKMIDVEQIYSNGTEFVPIFRVKQWLEYNNINNLQSKIDRAIEYIDNNSHYYTTDTDEIGFVIEEQKEEVFCKELLDILKEDK